MLGASLLDVLPDAVPPTVEVSRETIVDVLRSLRDDPETAFDTLLDLCGADHLGQGRPGRYAVVYHLFSFRHRALLRVRAWLPEDAPEIDSATLLWPAANWAEREAYDMYGIRFRGHPNLTRILLPDTYEGHPLRKDYPLQGRGERDRFPRYIP